LKRSVKVGGGGEWTVGPTEVFEGNFWNSSRGEHKEGVHQADDVLLKLAPQAAGGQVLSG